VTAPKVRKGSKAPANRRSGNGRKQAVRFSSQAGKTCHSFISELNGGKAPFSVIRCFTVPCRKQTVIQKLTEVVLTG
jgi:hypothetical protein